MDFTVYAEFRSFWMWKTVPQNVMFAPWKV